jgi:hypothetical protein
VFGVLPALPVLAALVTGTLAGCVRDVAPEATPSGDPARLAASNTFRTLVARVDLIGSTPRPGGCLLRRSPDGFELAADLAPAISPLPSVELAPLSALDDAETVRIVSRWGTDGASGPYVATFTHHPPLPAHLGVVVVVSGDRASLRSTLGDAPREDGLDMARVAARLVGVRERQPQIIVVAGPEVRVDVIARWLVALDALRMPMAFGMAVSTDRDLSPSPSSAGGSESARCVSLPALAEASPLGTMTPARLREALPGLREAVGRCTALVPSRAVATGGRIRLGARIGPDGRAREACVTDDSVDDDAFRICLVDAARTMTWPVPDTAGYVDVYVPLVVAADRSAVHRGVCE